MDHGPHPRLPALQAVQAARLYGIVDLGYVTPEDAGHAAIALCRGGVGVLQLRAKKAPEEIIRRLAKELALITKDFAVPFIVNDFPAIALEAQAEGVHVGQDDLTVAAARHLVGPELIVGKSTHSLAQAVQASADEADYIGFGPLFPTPTKAGRPAIGLQDIAEAHRQVTCPIFCIGGIKPENLDTVLAAGATRVVIVSALLQSSTIEATTRRIVERLSM